MHPAVLELKKRLQDRYGDRLVRFLVFGSYARGEQTPELDIDLFVTLQGIVDTKTKFTIWDIAFDIELEFDVILDVKVHSEENLQNKVLRITPFVINVMKEGCSV